MRRSTDLDVLGTFLIVGAMGVGLYGMVTGLDHALEPFSRAESICRLIQDGQDDQSHHEACVKEIRSRSGVDVAAPALIVAVTAATVGGKLIEVERQRRQPCT